MEQLTGSRILLERLCSGDWPDADFLVLAPGDLIDASWDEGVVCARRAVAGTKNATYSPSPALIRHPQFPSTIRRQNDDDTPQFDN